MIVEISVVPIGIGESLSNYIAEAVRIIKSRCKDYELTPMGTIVEVESFRDLGEILDEIIERLTKMGVCRIYTVIKSDFRIKKTNMGYKVEKVKMLLESQFETGHNVGGNKGFNQRGY